MLFVPARKRANQSELRQHEQKRFKAEGALDLLYMDLKIVKKGGRGKIHEASFNILDAWTGASRTYRLVKHDEDAIRNCLLHFCGRRACNYIIRGHSDNAGEITKACDGLGWISEPTAANRPVHNPFAERNIQTVTMGARCALMQSGLPVARFWADAEALRAVRPFRTAAFQPIQPRHHEPCEPVWLRDGRGAEGSAGAGGRPHAAPPGGGNARPDLGGSIAPPPRPQHPLIRRSTTASPSPEQSPSPDTTPEASPLPPGHNVERSICCLLYTSPSPRDATLSRMPSSA
mgnify:CR=1 FL=1